MLLGLRNKTLMSYKQAITNTLWFGLTPLLFLSTPTFADEQRISSEVKFQARPNRCITLRQGQVCYQKIAFEWSINHADSETTTATSEYCLVDKDHDLTIICWEGNDLTQFKFEFESTDERIYELRNQSSSTVLAQVKVNVAWVYKNSKNVSTGWRLF